MKGQKFWLTIERLAALEGVSIRTAWRLVRRNSMSLCKRNLPGKCHSVRRTFVLADERLRELERALCLEEQVISLQALRDGDDVYVYGYFTKDSNQSVDI